MVRSASLQWLSFRVSFYSEPRFITRTGTQNLFIADIQYFLRVVIGDGDVFRLAVCKVYPAKYGLPGLRAVKDVMSASLSARGELEGHEVLAVDKSQNWTPSL